MSAGLLSGCPSGAKTRHPLLEVMRCGGFEREVGQPLDLFCPDMDGAGTRLQDALHQEKAFLGNHQASSFKKLRINDYVGDTGFVFEADENDAFRRPGRWRQIASPAIFNRLPSAA